MLDEKIQRQRTVLGIVEVRHKLFPLQSEGVDRQVFPDVLKDFPPGETNYFPGQLDIGNATLAYHVIDGSR